MIKNDEDYLIRRTYTNYGGSKMCEYCTKIINNKKIKDIDEDKEDWLEIIYQEVHGNMIYVELDGTDNDGYKTADFFRINYCPMCGRKLGE